MLTILNISQNHYIRGGSDRYFLALRHVCKSTDIESSGLQRRVPSTSHLNRKLFPARHISTAQE